VIAESFKDNLIILCICILLPLTTIGPTISIGVINPTKCYITEGEIVGKDIEEGKFVLYVRLDYNAENLGYRVYVTPATYEEYEEGATFAERTCDLIEYEEIQQILDELLAWGLMEEM